MGQLRATSLALSLSLAAGTSGPAEASDQAVRFATFNASLARSAESALIADLTTPDDPQAQAVAEIIQRVRPDVLLLNEFDFDPDGQALGRFLARYLGRPQNGARPIHYPFVFLRPSNTGVPSGLDLDDDGATDGPGDAFGFGFFPGQFGMVLLSRFPIVSGRARTFRSFLWKDMPGALLPDDPATDAPADFYSTAELDAFRLSSKGHWDVPVRIPGGVVHVLASHPTPPVFDGPEDRNGRRNHDEIRFWADYTRPFASGYIYDDRGRSGGLRRSEPFIIMGDQNADPFDGDSTMNAARQLTEHPRIDTGTTPSSEGGVEASIRQTAINDLHTSDPAHDTADFNDDAPGNLRVDYVLPSRHFRIVDAAVFWPTADDPLFRLVDDGSGDVVSSDHRLVWVDLELRR